MGLGASQDEGVNSPCERGSHPQGFFRNLLLHQLVAQLCGLHTRFIMSLHLNLDADTNANADMQPMVLVTNHLVVWPYSIILDQANCVIQIRLTNVKDARNSRLPYSYTQPITSGM